MSSQTTAGELLMLLEDDRNRVFVTERPIDLRGLDQPNEVFVLEVQDGGPAVGGSKGTDDRKVTKAYHYRLGEGQCFKVAEFYDEEDLLSLDLPRRMTEFDVVMPDGRRKPVSGAVDPELVASYKEDLRQ